MENYRQLISVLFHTQKLIYLCYSKFYPPPKSFPKFNWATLFSLFSFRAIRPGSI